MRSPQENKSIKPITAFASPLGWEWSTHASSNHPISPESLPRLSHAEMLLVERMLAQLATIPESQLDRERLRQFILEYCSQHHLLIEHQQEIELLRVMELHTQPGGILQILLQDPSLEEIAIAGIGEAFPIRVWVTGEGWR